MRGKDADARPTPDLVDGVEDIHDIEAQGRWLGIGESELVRDTEIDLRVSRPSARASLIGKEPQGWQTQSLAYGSGAMVPR